MTEFCYQLYYMCPFKFCCLSEIRITVLLHLQLEGLFDEQTTQLRHLLQIYADSSQCLLQPESLVQIWLPLFPSNK